MEAEKPNNPKAFPSGTADTGEKFGDSPLNEGMTLRDYFAAKALPEIIRQWSRFDKSIDYKDSNQGDAENITEQSYYLADAMLKQREL